ncbi:FtsX-like permease family protein [Hoyosella sp. G463]|uniref:Cell division protein FtsX n=1 Tax=Lolliginicoccus lacisalsi TaxID=2742202 RepID=A0A927PNI6_9ACTN|nr:permease-like cell division protein FtsX [Lolliginicoccus lacisalsi]MBD8507906.1 FtsX-like permease family protein [Lolliginicoccus lacisalsi]
MNVVFLAREAITGLARNITMTVAMILTTAMSLGLLGGGLLIADMTTRTQQIYLDNVEVEIFLTEDISAADPGCATSICTTLAEDLAAFPGTDTVTYISRDEAVELYRETFADDPEILALVRAAALPASFRVRLDDPRQFAAIYDQFLLYPGVEAIRNQEELVKRLFTILDGLRNGAFAIAAVAGAAALLLIGNMVQITAYTRREEVSIMRLVGATRWYTQVPFILEALLAALLGAGIAIAGLFVAKGALVDGMLAAVYESNIIAPITTGSVAAVAPVLLGLAATLAAATGYVTLRFYVRD